MPLYDYYYDYYYDCDRYDYYYDYYGLFQLPPALLLLLLLFCCLHANASSLMCIREQYRDSYRKLPVGAAVNKAQPSTCSGGDGKARRAPATRLVVGPGQKRAATTAAVWQ